MKKILFHQEYCYVLESPESLNPGDYVMEAFHNIGSFQGYEEKPDCLLVKYAKGLCAEDLINIQKIVWSTDPQLQLPYPEITTIGDYSYCLAPPVFTTGEYGINLNSGSLFEFLEYWDESTLSVRFITGGNISQTICTESWSSAEPLKIIATNDPRFFTGE